MGTIYNSDRAACLTSVMEYVVLDFETTGLSPSRHRVIEVGAAIIVDDKIIQTFQQLTNPGVKIPSFITKFTGITNEMLVDKPKTEEVMERLHAFIGERPVVAHNASFDSKFLIAEMNRIKKKVSNVFLCTLLLSRRLLGGLSSYKLSSLKQVLQYQPQAEHRDHRALDDVLVTVHLWKHLQKVLSNSGLKQISVQLLSTITKLPKKNVFEFIATCGGRSISSEKYSIKSMIQRSTIDSISEPNEPTLKKRKVIDLSASDDDNVETNDKTVAESDPPCPTIVVKDGCSIDFKQFREIEFTSKLVIKKSQRLGASAIKMMRNKRQRAESSLANVFARRRRRS